jgi:hypothetical protein
VNCSYRRLTRSVTHRNHDQQSRSNPSAQDPRAGPWAPWANTRPESRTAAPERAADLVLLWSGRRDSNSRPSPWQGDALPAEPRPRYAMGQDSNSLSGAVKEVSLVGVEVSDRRPAFWLQRIIVNAPITPSPPRI